MLRLELAPVYTSNTVELVPYTARGESAGMLEKQIGDSEQTRDAVALDEF